MFCQYRTSKFIIPYCKIINIGFRESIEVNHCELFHNKFNELNNMFCHCSLIETETKAKSFKKL